MDSSSPVDLQERRARFLLEFENPFKCEKCGERFKRKKHLQEHKDESHSY
ncbi:MAG: C2H2-type zinc finger protein [Candidatus Nitrosopolaris sp.]